MDSPFSDLMQYITALKWLGNETMASGCENGTIRIWQIVTGECLEIFTGHSERVHALMLIDEQRMASVALNETVRVWNIKIRQSETERGRERQIEFGKICWHGQIGDCLSGQD